MAAFMLRHCASFWKLPAFAGLCLHLSTGRADCLDMAAALHHVDPALVRAVATTESHLDSTAHHLNGDGSEDIGLMEINSRWLPTLARYGISRASLLDGCTNAFVGTWILSNNISRLGLSWNAVGAYNASSPAKRLSYARRVYAQLMASNGSSVAASHPIASPALATVNVDGASARDPR